MDINVKLAQRAFAPLACFAGEGWGEGKGRGGFHQQGQLFAMPVRNKF